MNRVPPYLYRTCFIFLISVLLLFPVSSSGQIDRISPALIRDSLLALLNWQKGTARVKTLVLLSGQYRLADSSKSLDFSLEALSLAENLQNRKLVLSGTLGVALAYHHSGNYPRSVSYALEAADLALEAGDTMAWVRALTCAALGYLFSGNPELAMSIARTRDAENLR